MRDPKVNDHWIAGKRPEQSLQELQAGDLIRIIKPSGVELLHEVQSIHYDYQRGCQITLVRVQE